MRNPFKREKALTASGGVIDAIQQGFAPFQLLGSGARDRITGIYNAAQSANYAWLYIKSPALRTVIDLIVRDIGELDLCLYEEVSEQEKQPQDDHPAAMSLRYPDEGDTSDGFIRSLVKDFLIHDNSYSIINPAGNSQYSFLHVPSYMLQVQSSSMFRVDNYRVWPQGAWNSNGNWGGAGTYVDVDPENMLHWHGENPLDPRIGLSHLDTLRGVLAEDAALQQAIVELAQAGLQEPMWVFRPGDAPQWSNEARAGFEEDLSNRMRRRNSKAPVMEEGMELRSFGVSPHDAQMMDLRRWAVAQVAAEFGVPSGKVGLTPATEEDEMTFVKDVLKPLGKNFSKMLDQRVLVQLYDLPDFCFQFNLDERLMGDNRLQALTSAAGVPILLRNEARAMIGKPPVDGGDEPATPVNVILGGDPEAQLTARAAAAAPKPGSMVMPIQDPNKPPQDGSYRQEDGRTPIGSGNGGKAVQLSDDGSQRLPQYHPRRKADIERQRRHIDAFQGVVQKHFNRLERSLRAKAQTDWTRWDREFADDIDRELKRVVQSEGDIYSMKLAANNFQMGEVQHYLKAMADGAATAINDTIRQEIDSLGLDSALNLAPRHVSTAGTSLGARATIWAREESARQSGSADQRVKTWVADTDRHAEFDGDTVGLGEDWPAGFAPGSPPNCACTAVIS